MSDKLNQSLDEILKANKRVSRGRPAARRAASGKGAAAATAPVGGVKKNTKAPKAAAKANIPTGPASKAHGDSKIMVSNLPHDVTEPQIKEYFAKSVGPVKKVLLTYGPNGQSRGVATVIFTKPNAAAEAAAAHNGLKVDNRPMRVEVILGASDVPPPAAPKPLGERVQQPKNAAKAQPKPATQTKAAAAAGKAGKKRLRGKKTNRPKPKTAEELDAEMQDYFDSGNGAGVDGDTAMATNGGAVQAAGNGGDQMEDEVM
ncbi:RNA recognition motif containing protein [Lasiodiplodia theobromae]|uniref:RNA recognition motif containing protein n=1 Tax=Lasiodiplodia theobromae TaxID=45133 RepID=UPI0015C33D62|nr:RNA recognition motif containing protein [Lasiodiplodia theobromae]KAF4540467.1 RNA recognition motif containing protein [Lasiodiplodia theobromae]